MPHESLPDEQLPEELQDEQIVDLPPREALSIVDPGVFGLRTSIFSRAPDPSTTSEPTVSEGEPQD
jgi:hypothetical protein